MMEFVSWDDEIPIFFGNTENVPNHHPELIVMYNSSVSLVKWPRVALRKTMINYQMTPNFSREKPVKTPPIFHLESDTHVFAKKNHSQCLALR